MLKGSCLCGSVAFTIRGPITGAYQCHCSLCRKVTGSSANAATIVPTSQFEWLSGKGEIEVFQLETGYRVDFCRRCGSNVPNITASDTMWIPLGLLDGRTDLRITAHIHVDSRADWDLYGANAYGD